LTSVFFWFSSPPTTDCKAIHNWTSCKSRLTLLLPSAPAVCFADWILHPIQSFISSFIQRGQLQLLITTKATIYPVAFCLYTQFSHSFIQRGNYWIWIWAFFLLKLLYSMLLLFACKEAVVGAASANDIESKGWLRRLRIGLHLTLHWQRFPDSEPEERCAGHQGGSIGWAGHSCEWDEGDLVTLSPLISSLCAD